MGQQEISELFKRMYPKYMDYKEIMVYLNISRRNVIKNLAKMRKRDEVEYIMVLSDSVKGIWIRKYREKR